MSNDSIETLIKSNSKRLSKTQILCVGDMILDQYIYGKVERMSPEAPVPILSVNEENYSIKPDLTALGKIIGGGFPIGALAGKSEIMKVLDPTEKVLKHPHSGTFSANPISTTAGFTAMKMFDKEAVIKLNHLTSIAKDQIQEAIKLSQIPACITGVGSMFRIHLQENQPATFREAYQSEETKEVINDLLDYLFIEENIIMINTCACMFSTSLIQDDIDKLSEALLRGFNKIKNKLN